MTLLAELGIFFDRFGVFVFLFIALDAYDELFKWPWQTKWKLSRYPRPPRKPWASWTRLAIGILGFIVDGGLVLFTDLSRLGLW